MRNNAFKRVIQRAFEDRTLEEAYQTYVQRSKAADLDCFFLTGCLVAVHATVSLLSLEQHAVTDGEMSTPSVKVLVCTGFSSIVAITMASLGFYIRGRNSRTPDDEASVPGTPITDRLLYFAWLLANVLILSQLILVPPVSWSLTWLLLFNFLTCITLSVRLRICLLLTSGASLFFLGLSIWTLWDSPLDNQSSLHQQVRELITF